MNNDIETAKLILRGETGEVDKLYELADRLKNENYFGYGRKLFERIEIDATHPRWRRVKQRLALCTYKDPDLPSDDRLDSALNILRTIEDLNTTQDRETLGLTGAIYKRMWEENGQRINLERSLSFYTRGHKSPQPDHDGYCGINAAFLLDLIGSEELAGGDPAAQTRFDEARRIRLEIVTSIEPKAEAGGDWWQLATLAEANLGLGDVAKAKEWLARPPADNKPPKEWELESTVRQLATLARLTSAKLADGGTFQRAAETAIREALRLPAAAVTSGAIGKVGLALSGGGMRAALYHIGVFARLAEMDLLRHVDAISCVSGGSIVGAYYYLKLKNLLESTDDDQINRADYVELVRQMAAEFKAGVQENIRTRVAASFFANLRMIFSEEYSRTDRAGELYERHLYQRITGNPDPILLRSLVVSPKDAGTDFRPKYDNWRRLNKVPILVLNATVLNTGHQWQFTSTFMGEPPQRRSGGIDAIYRLRRMYISDEDSRNEAPGEYRNVRLGVAVGASAAVPGLFEPVTFKDLYENKTIRLVDGGVHDNQGVASLIEQSCKVILVSDASGQMKATDTPSRGTLGVLKRSDDVLQARLRQAQHSDLVARRRSGLLQGTMFIHLTKDLAGEDVNWLKCKDPAPKLVEKPLTPYGIDRVIQRQLSEIRTDLDSFSDAECYSLMTSGYLMAKHELNTQNAPTLWRVATQSSEPWQFLSAKTALDTSDGEANDRMRSLLKESHRLAFKIWYQKPWLKRTGWTLQGLLVLGLLVFALANRSVPAISVTYGAIVIFIIGLITTKLGLHWLRHLNYRNTLTEIAQRMFFATIGWVGAHIHLGLFDPMFLKHGRWAAAAAPSGPPTFASPGPRVPVGQSTPPAPIPPPPAARPAGNEVREK